MNISRYWKILTPLTATALISPLAMTSATAATAGDSDDFSTNGQYGVYYGQKLTWSPADCPSVPGQPANPHFECATMRVPKDWYAPAKGDISVKLARKVGENTTGKRLMLSNPGGPGGSGLGFGASVVPTLLGITSTHYSVGIDPRGIGASTPLTCDTSKLPALEPELGPDLNLRTRTREQIRAAARNQAILFSTCQSQPAVAELAPYINSDQTARDFNLARHVLGFAQADYYGVSYGTWLGSVIAKLFPSKFDRLLFDGNIGWNDISWDNAAYLQMTGHQAMFDRMVLPFIARNHERYGLGKTTVEVNRSYEKIRAELNKANASIILDLFIPSFQYSAEAPDIIGTFLSTVAKSEGKPAEIAAIVQRTRKQLKLLEDGPLPPVLPLGHYAVACGDVVSGQDAEGWYTKMEGILKTMPIQSFQYAVPHCYGWKSTSALSRELQAKPVKQVLMLHQEADPATGYLGARDARMHTRGNVKMVFVDDLGGHGTSYMYSRCARSYVEDYVKRGVFPAHDVACQMGPFSVSEKNPTPGEEIPSDGAVKAAALEPHVYEFLNPATASTPLPRGNFYLVRDLSEPALDPTTPGLITSGKSSVAQRSASTSNVVGMDQLRQINDPATYRLPFQR